MKMSSLIDRRSKFDELPCLRLSSVGQFLKLKYKAKFIRYTINDIESELCTHISSFIKAHIPSATINDLVGVTLKGREDL